MQRSSHLAGTNSAYIEAMYENYLSDPNAVPPEWRAYFNQLPHVSGAVHGETPHRPVIEHFERVGRNRLKARPEKVSADIQSAHEIKQMYLADLIAAYRRRGHMRADLDPLKLMARPAMPVLDIRYHGLTPADYDEVFDTGTLEFPSERGSLREIIAVLEATYCGSVGAEFMHILDAGEQMWVQQRLERVRSQPVYSSAEKRMLLERLTAAEGLEKYLHNRYPGTKRFGLEGLESLIPCMHALLQRLGGHGLKEAVIGMAHRGRLNVLVNIFGKNPAVLFAEFDGQATPERGSGDVKYHQGFSTNIMTPGGEMHLALAFNPSHLEIVGPVVEGSVRARQDRRGDRNGSEVAPIIIHGDAAFAGQGVVMETFQMSRTRGYGTGGTIHIIVNNQIGFTTSEQADARSTDYCTEIAKMVQAPIFHVNADDPEAVLFVTRLAADYRAEFRKDVVIDLVGYRRRGHNEAEEPAKTQPIMYQKIHKHPTTRTLYADRLVADGVLSRAEADAMVDTYRDMLDSGEGAALAIVRDAESQLNLDWRPYLGHDWTTPSDTRLTPGTLQRLNAKLERLPENFVLHAQVKKIVEDRHRMAAGAMPVNWGFAEVMAYASLLDAGVTVRLTGQDVGVGTFSHRHAVVHNQKNGDSHCLLANIRDDVPFLIYDSLLSEEAVLAFEFGYATSRPRSLTIWEAQFGDFANGAQVVIDQFISSGETKWGRLCGLTLLLPHGQEGAGPEHSSARLERFLQLCAEHNMQVCVPSTPAQVFHMIRRQSIRPWRVPLIAMTPKSLLRHKLAVSSLDELEQGQFHNVIGEVDDHDPAAITRLVLCAGKVYYELLTARREAEAGHIAIVRIEQLYPFPEAELSGVIAPYVNLEEVIWCQEEPMNQGAWYASQHHMRRVVLDHSDTLYLSYAGREPHAAPACGYASLFNEQQRKLVHDALFG
ncbi:MAG: 2-oxoglutarate dehydrogenase E1 component [Pseudomonadales bacterium]|nr:2-oxoglutarate dehydrogenase E1 component [Pseudomonadales bacterium]MCP5183941.1 2-oxoglutarate dehydrogenase E1 component [Pseudomonadales bacterium]